MRFSMSRIAHCRDNAVAESFFSTLKNEQTLHDGWDKGDGSISSFEDVATEQT